MIKTQSFFLKLPKELRLQVYEYLLKPERLSLRSLDSPSIIGTEHEALTTRFYAQTTGKKLHPEILRVCRVIYNEAHSILGQPEILSLDPAACSLYGLIPIGKTMDIRLLQGHSTITQIDLNLAPLRCTIREDFAHARLLASQLSPDLILKKITILLEDYSPDEEDDDDRVTMVEDVREMLRIWEKVRPSRDCNLVFILEPNGYDIGLRWKWDHAGGTRTWVFEDVEREDGTDVARPLGVRHMLATRGTSEYDAVRQQSLVDAIQEAYPT